MTTKSTTPDIVLSDRCAAILRHHGKPMNCLQMARLLCENSSECYRAMCAIPGVIIDGSGSLTKFGIRHD